MSQTRFVGLIQDPGINLKTQLFLRFGTAFICGKLGDYWPPAIARINKKLMEMEKVNESEKQDLINESYETLKETYEALNGAITPEKEEELRKEFNDICNGDISKVGITLRDIENQTSGLLQNDFLRGGTITFLKPEEPIEDENLDQIQEDLLNRYKDHFDLQDSSSMLPVKIPFVPQNLETEYENLINQKNKIEEILRNSELPEDNEKYRKLSESDKKYCEQALGDISSFLVYLSAQMTTIVSLEPQATMEEVENLRIKLFENLALNSNVRELNLFGNLLSLLDKTSVELVQKFLNEAKNPRDAAQKIYDALLASQKEVELNCRSLDPNISNRGDIDQVPVNINSRFRDLIDMYSQIDTLGISLRNGNDINTGAYNLPITRISDPKMFPIYKLYNEILIERKNIESEIAKIGHAILPKTKDEKRNLEEKLNLLNEYAEKLDENILNIKVFFHENEEENRHDINEKVAFLFNNFEGDISKKLEFCDKVLTSNYDFINKASEIFKSSIFNKDKVKSYEALCYIFKNNISVQEFIKEDGKINIEALCDFYDKNNEVQKSSQISIVKSKIKNENKNKKSNIKQETK